ncbi:MAG: hypothetical protein NC177_17430 [Ruminococcus flavefaciens]|nr:hypothetical protein [Ruminococcus flavefaciens]
MNEKISLNVPIRAVIVKILSYDPELTTIFGRSKDNDLFFQDLLTIGCDFYELLELFINCDAVTNNSIACIVDNVPSAELIKDFSEKELRKMIPHWTASKYRTAPIHDVCKELKEHIEQNSHGTFVYNSNLNSRNKKSYNDVYVLILAGSDKFFFDINRKKTFRLCEKQKEENT